MEHAPLTSSGRPPTVFLVISRALHLYLTAPRNLDALLVGVVVLLMVLALCATGLSPLIAVLVTGIILLAGSEGAAFIASVAVARMSDEQAEREWAKSAR